MLNAPRTQKSKKDMVGAVSDGESPSERAERSSIQGATSKPRDEEPGKWRGGESSRQGPPASGPKTAPLQTHMESERLEEAPTASRDWGGSAEKGGGSRTAKESHLGMRVPDSPKKPEPITYPTPPLPGDQFRNGWAIWSGPVSIRGSEV